MEVIAMFAPFQAMRQPIDIESEMWDSTRTL